MNEIEKAIEEFDEFIKMGYSNYLLPSSWSIKLATETLEKQKEKKPYILYGIYSNGEYKKYAECPNCGHSGLEFEKHIYCWLCGQKINWSRDDE